ncbi:MAG: acylneuraminate cytidylyltransferase [Thaumarchaeota archaeon]|nr:MAG: acylneuraminate cytidylyltransferase [Nitrososphaerota archaeon]
MKVIVIIQARMGSTRLPGKVLKIIEGKPLLEHQIDFLKQSELSDQIIIATTTLLEDNKIEDLANRINITCFRGNRDDVLERYYKCAKKFKGDLIVRITADNPLVEPTLVDKIIQLAINSKCDFATNMIKQTYPLGYLVEVFPFNILENLYLNQKDPLTREHVTYHIKRNPTLYNIQNYSLPQEIAHPEWRLAVDEEKDFEIMKKIFSFLYVKDEFIRYESIIDLLESHNDLVLKNEKYPDSLAFLQD